MKALLNGKVTGELIQSRGLHFGDGVFRTLLIWRGQPVDWDLHMQKLSQDCTALQLKMPDIRLLRAEADQLTHQSDRAVLKIILCRRYEGRGYASETEEVDRLLLLQLAPLFPLAHWTEGIQLFVCGISLSPQPALAGIKHLNRLEQVLASRHWPKDMDEGILCDKEGCPVSGTRTNLFWIKNGTLHTPLLHSCGVSGVMRKKIMLLSYSNKIMVTEVTAPMDHLHQADEVFVTNSLLGIWPVRQLENRTWHAPGPITQRLQIALNHPRLAE